MTELTVEARLAQAAELALKTISIAAAEAAHVVAQKAAESVKAFNAKDGADHDLLQRVDEKLDGLKSDFRDLKTGTSDRIGTLEREKNNIRDSYLVLFKTGVDASLSDNNKRLLALETSKTRQNTTMGIGMAILSLLTTLLIIHMFR